MPGCARWLGVAKARVHEVQQIGALEYRDEGYFLLCGQTLSLTPREQALLTVLMFRRTRPVSRQQLFEQVFSLNDDVSPESIELYIHRLRKKLQGEQRAYRDPARPGLRAGARS